MYDANTAQKLREQFANFLLHFAQANTSVSEPPVSLEETLQHGAAGGRAAPFHFTLFPEIIRFKALERSFSSALGSVFESAALTIGKSRFEVAEPQHVVSGRARAIAVSFIDQVIKDYETTVNKKRVRVPNTAEEHRVLDELLGPGGDGELFQERVDLFLKGSDGVEHYFHMKTVKPNRDQSNKAKRLMLRVHALRYPNPTRVFFGMAYNPFGEGNAYRWSFATPYFDFDHEVLVGARFWDYIGGPGTFLALLDLCNSVGRDIHDQLVSDLGLG